MKRTWVLTLGLLLPVLSTTAWGTTLRMDELPFQPVNGLTFEGVTFGFTVGGSGSTDANYDALNGGIQTYTQDPVIEGDAAGVLMLDFAQPTPLLEFGVSESTDQALTPGFQVELFDAQLNSLGVTPVNTAPVGADFFTEGLFTYQGTPVRRAVVTFSAGAQRFGFDNLTFIGAASPAPALSPIGLALAMMGLITVGAIAFGNARRRSERAEAR